MNPLASGELRFAGRSDRRDVLDTGTLNSVNVAATAADRRAGRRSGALWPFAAGATIGLLGGLIGLGGAEFRLPLLMTLFGFAALDAVILNKAMSLVVVVAALPARAFAVPWAEVADHWWVAANLLAGSLVGAWVAAGWATRMHSRTLHRTLAVLLAVIAVVLAASHYADVGSVDLPTGARAVVGVVAGVLIGMVAAFMGVAGGELLIPTIVLLFAADVRLAGSLSLVVSLPTMLVGFARYSRGSSFQVIGDNLRFVAGARITFTRNDDYWRGRPALDGIDVSVIPDPQAWPPARSPERSQGATCCGTSPGRR